MSTQKKGRGGGKRRRAREMAMQMLYQMELGGSNLKDVFAAFDVSDYVAETDSQKADGQKTDGQKTDGQKVTEQKADGAGQEKGRQARVQESFSYAQQLVRGTLEGADSIDSLIRQHAENWRLERMPTIDRNILRLAVYEMLHEESVPKVVIVDEAIELAKKFGSENSSRFVNGLLDGVLKSTEMPAAAAVHGSDGEG